MLYKRSLRVLSLVLVLMIALIPVFVFAGNGKGNPNKDNTWVVFQNQRIENGSSYIDMVVRDYGSGGLKTIKYGYGNGRGKGQYPSEMITINISERGVAQHTVKVPLLGQHEKFIFVQVYDYNGYKYTPELGFGPFFGTSGEVIDISDINITRYFDQNLGKYVYELEPVFTDDNAWGDEYLWEIISGSSYAEFVDSDSSDPYIELAEKNGGGTVTVKVSVLIDGQWYYKEKTFQLVSPINISVSEQYAKVKEVTVTLGYFSEATSKQYRIGETGQWVNYTAPFVVAENTTVYARCIDGSGSEIIIQKTISNIDNIAPTATFSYNTTSITNQNVVATLVPSEPITVTNNGGSMTYTFAQNGQFTFEFVDAAGNTGTATAIVENIDKTAPTGTISYSTTDMTSGSVTATLSTSEPVTIINTENGVNTYTFDANGSFTFEFVDAAGNTGTATAIVENIDKTAPIGTISYSTTNLTTGSVTATLSTSEPVTVTNNGGSMTYTFTQNEQFTFEFVDAAGNTGTATAIVNNIINPTEPEEMSLLQLKSPINNDNITSVIQGGSLEFIIKVIRDESGELVLILDCDDMNKDNGDYSDEFFQSITLRQTVKDNYGNTYSFTKMTDGSRKIVLSSNGELIAGTEYQIKIVIRISQTLPVDSYEMRVVGTDQRLQIDVVELPPLL